MSFDLIKNAMGLLFLTSFMLFYVLMLKTGRKLYMLLSILMLVLTGLTHILDYGIALLFLILSTIMYFRDRKALLLTIPILMGGLLFLSMGFIFLYIMGGDPYKIYSFLIGLSKSFMNTVIPISAFNVIYPLLTGMAGIIISSRLGKIEGKLLLSLSIMLIALNTPLIPQEYLWRFNLMSAILIPLVIGLSLSPIKDKAFFITISLIIVGFTLPQFSVQLAGISPSIPLGEYHEIEELVKRLPTNNTAILVPDTRLRYWIEVLYPHVYRRLNDIQHNVPIILVYDRVNLITHNARIVKPKIPPIAKPFYIGRYIEAYIIPPRP